MAFRLICRRIFAVRAVWASTKPHLTPQWRAKKSARARPENSIRNREKSNIAAVRPPLLDTRVCARTPQRSLHSMRKAKQLNAYTLARAAVRAEVEQARRARTMRNHSVTHLMHHALREVRGAHVQQKGSRVDADKTRFDFSHSAPLNRAQIQRVEALVNAEILRNAPTKARTMPYDEAIRSGAVALFGEKYGDSVRVLDIGFSRE